MRYFKGGVSTNLVGSDCSFEFEVEDDATEEEIEEIAREAAFDYIDWWYDEVNDEDDIDN